MGILRWRSLLLMQSLEQVVLQGACPWRLENFLGWNMDAHNVIQLKCANHFKSESLSEWWWKLITGLAICNCVWGDKPSVTENGVNMQRAWSNCKLWTTHQWRVNRNVRWWCLSSLLLIHVFLMWRNRGRIEWDDVRSLLSLLFSPERKCLSCNLGEWKASSLYHFPAEFVSSQLSCCCIWYVFLSINTVKQPSFSSPLSQLKNPLPSVRLVSDFRNIKTHTHTQIPPKNQLSSAVT